MRCTSNVPIVFLACCTPLGQARGIVRAPLWTHDSPQRMEWATILGDHDGGTLVVATSQGEVRLLAADTGLDRLASPVRMSAGVRPVLNQPGDSAASAATQIYLFDRRTAAALAPDGPNTGGADWRVVWRADVVARTDDEPDDPEKVVRLVGATAVSRGLFVVRSDGRLALLSASRGEPLWEDAIKPVAEPVIHQAGFSHQPSAASGRPDDVIWLVAAQREGVRVHQFDLAATPPRTLTLELDRFRPLAGWATRDGLVLIEPNRLALLTTAGNARITRAPGQVTFGAATTALLEPGAAVINRGAPAPHATLWTLATSDRAVGIDVATGCIERSVTLTPPADSWLALQRDPARGAGVRDRRLRLEATDRVVLVRVPREPTSKVWTFRLPAQRRLVAAHATNRRIYACAEPSDRSRAGDGPDAQHRHGRLAVLGAELPPATADEFIGTLTELFTVEMRERLVDVAWTERFLLLVEPSRIRAFAPEP